MEIGSHCHYFDCNRLDFLPIKCPSCKNLFCKDHSLPNVHQCPNLSQFGENSAIETKEKSKPEKEICFIGGCQVAGVKGICQGYEKF